MGLEDPALVRVAQEARPGDGRAFNELVRRHQGRVRANCRFLTGNEMDAEDLSQEVFIKAYFALAEFEGRSQFGTWVRRIKVNHCLNYLEAEGRRSFLDVEGPVVGAADRLRVAPRGPRSVDEAELRTRVERVLGELHETLRVPLVLRDMDGMSYTEVAEALGVGLSAAKMRIKRAREAFRAAWVAMEGGDIP